VTLDGNHVAPTDSVGDICALFTGNDTLIASADFPSCKSHLNTIALLQISVLTSSLCAQILEQVVAHLVFGSKRPQKVLGQPLLSIHQQIKPLVK
jgi:hypothetical protein